MSEILLFSSLQNENLVTNYCGLMLKLIYEENPVKFEKLLSEILSGESISVMPKFEQQKKGKDSIPDLIITQEGYQLFFETKKGSAFTASQIKRHLESISHWGGEGSKKILFLLGNYQNNEETIRDIFESEVANELERLSREKKIFLVLISFEQLMEQVRKITMGTDLEKTAEEFENFLSKEDLLPRWKYLLDVVNCGRSIEEFKQGYYVCPESGAAYQHKRAKYLGGYYDKKVSHIAEVEAMVAIRYENEKYVFEQKWANTKISEKNLQEKTIKGLELNEERIKEIKKGVGFQVFILKDVSECNFEKDSRGGMFASKIYFDLQKLEKESFSSVKELAELLSKKKWSDFK